MWIRPRTAALLMTLALACDPADPRCEGDCPRRDVGGDDATSPSIDGGSAPSDASRVDTGSTDGGPYDGGSAAPDGGPSDLCTEVYGTARPTHPSFEAFGFARQEVPFATIWGVAPTESAPSRGVPGVFLDPSERRYLSIPIVIDDDAGGARSQVRMTWIEVQPTGDPSLLIPTGPVSITVSPCPGDFRAPGSRTDPDPYLRPSCRPGVGISGSMEITTSSLLSGCRVPRGRTVYLNIATYDMFGGTEPAGTLCSGTSTCGVSMRML